MVRKAYGQWARRGFVAMVSLLAAIYAEAQLGFDPPHALNSNAATDGPFVGDNNASITTDSQGNWVVVWYFDNGDDDIAVSRSTDNGKTWTNQAALNTNAATDSGDDRFPVVSTDGHGNWVTVWASRKVSGGTLGSDTDILVARSANNGQTWSAPAPLNTNAASDSGGDFFPFVNTDGNGNWVAAWHSFDTLGGTIGTDGDILYARSTNNGQTWTAPLPLNTDANADEAIDSQIDLATDREGNWVAAWTSRDSVGGTVKPQVARSANNGQTWTAPAPLITHAVTGTLSFELEPDVTTDGDGNWVLAWRTNDTLGGTIGSDLDIIVALSTNNGQTWTAPAPLNTTASTGSGSDSSPRVTTDRMGNWVAVWESFGTIGSDYEILFARSANNGQIWTAPMPVISNAASDSIRDFRPDIATDGEGNWVVVWDSADRQVEGIRQDLDIRVASVVPPVVKSIRRASNNPTNAELFNYLVTFSESVTGVNLTDFRVVDLNGNATNLLVKSVQNFDVPPSSKVTVKTGSTDGTFALQLVDNGSIKDNRNNKLGGLVPGNGTFLGEPFTVDTTRPGVLISSTAPNPTVTSPIPVTVAFTEAVFGFVVSDVVAGNATVQNFAGSGAAYSFNLLPTNPGVVTANIAAGIATDLTGNSNTAAAQFSRTFNGLRLTVLAPNGGEQLRRGRNTQIRWASLGSVGANVKVELLRNGALIQTIFNSTPNDGAQQWAIPSNLVVGNGYAVRITDTSNSANTDTSDAVFRIKNP